jgi:hypothetical protein
MRNLRRFITGVKTEIISKSFFTKDYLNAYRKVLYSLTTTCGLIKIIQVSYYLNYCCDDPISSKPLAILTIRNLAYIRHDSFG